MAMRRVSIDTSASSRLAAGDASVLEVLGEAQTVTCRCSAKCLLADFKGGLRERKNRDGLKTLVAAPSVKLLLATDTTVEIFSSVKDSPPCNEGESSLMNDVNYKVENEAKELATHRCAAAEFRGSVVGEFRASLVFSRRSFGNG